MAYCQISDVASLNKARILGQGNNPTAEDVQTYINMSAATIDAILTNKGYQVPVSSAYTEAFALLNAINATGAVALMERASPTPGPNLDRWEKEWEEHRANLVNAEQIMDAPKDQLRAEPRGPGVTTAPGICPGETLDPVRPYGSWHPRQDRPGIPMFSRTMQF